jgi:D-alanyl-D-alanine carboxypeptidase
VVPCDRGGPPAGRRYVHIGGWEFMNSGMRVGRTALPAVLVSIALLGVGACGTSTAPTAEQVDTSPLATAEPDPPVEAEENPTPTLVSSDTDEEFLAAQIERVRVPGDSGSVLIALVQPAGTISHASTGSGPGGATPTAEDTFRIGSITKVFTSLVTLSLVDDGLVDLDASASSYVTRVDVPPAISVRDLLQHTSGIPNFTSDPAFYSRMVDDPSRFFQPEETFDLVADEDLDFDPGARFAYSNSNYLVLGLLIEEVTGRAAADELRSRILDPLDMTDTYLSGFEPGPPPFGSYTSIYGATQPIDFDYSSIESDAWMAGAMVSSARDLHTLFTALVAGELVSAASFAEMTSDDRYGLGLITDGFGSNDSLIGHNGGIVGYQTLVLHSPETGRTAFWVSGEDIDFRPAIEAVANRLAG